MLVKILGTFFVDMKKFQFRFFMSLIFTKIIFLGFVYNTILCMILTYYLVSNNGDFVKVILN